jgi:sugar phosphate isomerase/epimerase
MIFGYNTNGFTNHRLTDALMVLAQLGYGSVAITIDHDFLDPYAIDLGKRLTRIKSLLQRFGLRCVIETGARFLLDPLHKHQPTLISPKPEERQQRMDFILHAVNMARELGAEAVSFWSGTPTHDEPEGVHMKRLVESVKQLCKKAEDYRVKLAFEPEPGMLVDSMAQFEELHKQIDHPLFGLTMDVGHLHCVGDTPIAYYLRRWKDLIWNVHIEDMKSGVHDHLMFGEGEIDFVPVMQALKEIGYRGGIHVELPRHSHDAVNAASKSLDFLRNAQR